MIDKRWYDAFAGSALDGALRARGVTSLVVTGTMTEVCVLATAIGAFNREYRVTVVEDGVTTLWPEIQRGPPSISSPGLWARRIIKQVVDTVSAWK